jgi:hypothetical protein
MIIRRNEVSKVLFNINNYATVELFDDWEIEIKNRFEKYNHNEFSMVNLVLGLIKRHIKAKDGKQFYTDQLHAIINNFGDCFQVGMAHGIKPYFIIDKKDLEIISDKEIK